MKNTENETVLVVYSGGRDSSAATIEMARLGHKVKLFTYQAGLPELTGRLGDSAPEIRHKELLDVFPENIEEKRVIEGNTYLLRKLALEKTNVDHVVYPIALTLAVHCGAIKYCLENNIKTIVSGYSGYQAKQEKYIEQRDDFVTLTRDFLKNYDIEYKTPVIDKTENDVKDILERHGISSNSLENKSIFGGLPFEEKFTHTYWDASISICKKYLENIKKK